MSPIYCRFDDLRHRQWSGRAAAVEPFGHEKEVLVTKSYPTDVTQSLENNPIHHAAAALNRLYKVIDTFIKIA